MFEILPAIDLRGGRCVRLRQGDYAQETVFSDDPVTMARQWEAEGAARLHLVDLDGAKAGRPVHHEIIRAIVRAVRLPCQVGGGLREDADVQTMLEDVGVQRVIVGTRALQDPDWFARLVEKYPRRVCLGLDARDSRVATAGWLEVSQTPALELARRFQGLDVGAVIYTNIANDGMMQGVDDDTLHDLAALSELGLPVIASGGVTTLADIERLCAVHRRHPRLVGAIVGRALYEGTLRVAEAVAAAARLAGREPS
jgi:phosphoribosylformimino-5-aminoimidazole carboxamide ribotide isomerase